MKTGTNDLLPHWLILGFMALTLAVYLIIGLLYGQELMTPLPESQRIVIRSVFYILAILGFPVTNLIRHIQVRLNQTMPGSKPAKSRYLLTVIVSMVMAESIGLLGFILFMLGDDYNSLYIFTGLAVLALFLYRPKQEEYESIVEALSTREQLEESRRL